MDRMWRKKPYFVVFHEETGNAACYDRDYQLISSEVSDELLELARKYHLFSRQGYDLGEKSQPPLWLKEDMKKACIFWYLHQDSTPETEIMKLPDLNINAAIIDQRLNALMNDIREEAKSGLNITDDNRLKSLAFIYLTAKTVLNLSHEETFDCLTEGGGDFGVDAVHISEPIENEFTVCLFQGKYQQKLEATANFPENGIKALIFAVQRLFDPSLKISYINPRLASKLGEILSFIQEGYIPQVRLIACNNGQRWNESAQQEINRAQASFGNQVLFEYVNHNDLVTILQATKSVNDKLQLSGKAMIEDFNFSRILIGRVAVHEIADLMKRHGERLLERNIRRYLGLRGNRVNEAIYATLQNEEENENFYFYNNGITLVCDKFSYNALQGENYQVNIENLQIINGGQTCMTIYKALLEGQLELFERVKNAFILVRLYQLPTGNSSEFIQKVTFATNSQNPVELRDLRANDYIQKRLEMDIAQLGYHYQRKRSDISSKNNDISISVTAEAVLAIWRKRPHQTKFFSREHFGKLYSVIFTDDLNGSQAIIAVLLFRIAENHRKRPPENAPLFLTYASCFIAMQMGKILLARLNLKFNELNHQNFAQVVKLIEQEGNAFFQQALTDIETALKKLYSDDYLKNISLPQLSATFRRSDLIDLLK